MRKIFIFVLSMICTFIVCISCDDDCDHNISSGKQDTDICGIWYNELYNEEIRYFESGMFYSKSSNTGRAQEIDGRYEYNKGKKTLYWTYYFMGQSQLANWKVEHLDNKSLTIYSSMVGEFTYEKVDSVYYLKVGEEINESKMLGALHSTNERIVKVEHNGTIKAVGGKGYAYVKIPNADGYSWIKVVVGDDRLDLWYDYVNVLGLSYSDMTRLLGNPSYAGTDGLSYAYQLPDHNLIDHVGVSFDEFSKKSYSVILYFKKDSPKIEILDYVKSHYYVCEEIDNDIYMSEPVLGFSKANIMYNEGYNALIIGETLYKFKWLEFMDDFGKDVNAIVKKHGELYLGELPLYNLSGNSFLNNVYFLFDNTTEKVTAYELSVKENLPVDYVNNTLSFKYHLFKTEGNMYGYYDAKTKADAQLLIVYDADKCIVDYFDLNNYGKSSKALGLNNNTLNKFF